MEFHCLDLLVRLLADSELAGVRRWHRFLPKPYASHWECVILILKQFFFIWIFKILFEFLKQENKY